MLEFKESALRRGPRVLIEDTNFTIHHGYKVGVAGANGTGKSSLFEAILGRLDADTGTIGLPPGVVIAHVAQEMPEMDCPAIDFVMDGDQGLRRVEAELAKAEQGSDGTLQAELHARLDGIGGYSARSRAARLMHGLGFTGKEDENPVNSFSGGWRMRLNLAQALMCRSDVLLLDEPTNHLDLDAVIWLENWLARYQSTLLLISHDREFLDRVTDHILFIERQHADLYTGNYSEFEIQRAAKLAGQQAEYVKQQREITHIKAFITRFRAKATKARQAQSRIKALERMEIIAPAHVDSKFHFSFHAPEKLPDQLLKLEDIHAGYDGQPVLTGVDCRLLPGQRIGLIGANGAGKSTLTKVLAGGLAPLQGDYIPAKDLVVGYFAQHQLKQLDVKATPLLHLQRIDEDAGEKVLRDFLGRFGFGGERVEMPVAPFSGGEKARLVLAMLVYQCPNLLLLDEPTNHLDLDMRHALTMALQEYEGALVLVSHDRHLIRTVTDELWLVDGGSVQLFDGDIDDYAVSLFQRQSGEDTSVQSRDVVSRKTQRQQAAELRKQLQPLRSRVKKLEKQMSKLTAALEGLEKRLSDPKLYGDGSKDELQIALKEQGSLRQQLATIEVDWLAASEMLEQAEAGCG